MGERVDADTTAAKVTTMGQPSATTTAKPKTATGGSEGGGTPAEEQWTGYRDFDDLWRLSHELTESGTYEYHLYAPSGVEGVWKPELGEWHDVKTGKPLPPEWSAGHKAEKW